MSEIKEVELLDADTAPAAMDAILANCDPAALPPPCGVLDQCECGLCETAHAEYLATEAAAL